MPQDIVDLEEIIKDWATETYSTDVDRQYIQEIQSSDIDWSEVRITHEPVVYTDQLINSSPNTQVLFTAHFENNTQNPQVFRLKSERSTTSVCNLSMEKTFTKGFHLDLKLQPPNPIVEANAGFKGEVSITDSVEETFEEQMTWSVNNDIRVPPKIRVTAELVLTEVEYSSKFSCKTKLTGVVHVLLKNTKRDKERGVMTPVEDIFKPDLGFENDTSGRVYFVSKGECHCRYGLEQHVRLLQQELEG